jgi:hypothetical protein
VSDAVKTKRIEGAYVAHNSGTHSSSNFAPFVSASSSVIASTVVGVGAVIAAAPPRSSDEDKAATAGGARCSPVFAAEDAAADGFSEGDEEDDDEVVANAARERRRVLVCTLTRPDVDLIDDDDGVSLVFIVPLILVVFTVGIDMEADVNIILQEDWIGWITITLSPPRELSQKDATTKASVSLFFFFFVSQLFSVSTSSSSVDECRVA